MNAPLVSYDASDLPNIIARAMALFDQGDVIAARGLAAVGYDMAKTAAKFAASERLIGKARQLQGDALLIECRAKVKIADEWDAAQAAGQAATGGRPKKGGKTVSDANGFTAEQAGLTRHEIFEARRLRDAEAKAPGIAERAIAARLAQGFEPTRAALMQDADILSRAKEIRQARQKERHGERLAKMAAVSQSGQVTAGVVTGKFAVIYADAPWQFGVRSEETGREKSAENHYPTMPTEDIELLFDSIGAPAADDSVLFFWATNPMLPEALGVMAAWGFKYVHHWIWDKEIAGTGYWGRDRHELLLIGRRGNVAAPLPGTQPETVHREAKTRHSAKPDWYADQIDRLYPGVAKLELFCRAPRGGDWQSWGFEAKP
jgi:N6-adenosine-specific RNA methylase IME4